MSLSSSNPIAPFLDRQELVILDGGLATELEARGHDLADDLWSARLLVEDPDAIRTVHLDYLEAGADCIVSASYQATIEGFQRIGMDEGESIRLLEAAVELAVSARDRFWGAPAGRPGRLRPLVAASVGPYGAALADGSEYTGDYDLDEDGLVGFHRRRFELLAASAADLLACETIPSGVEARALAGLLAEIPGVRAWMSFSCRDGRSLCDGTDFESVVVELSRLPQLVAIGVNCTAPRFVPDLIARARGVTDLPIVVYPNSGELFDAETNSWLPAAESIGFATAGRAWRDLGASLIGGCCRIGPSQIAELRRRLLAPPAIDPA